MKLIRLGIDLAKNVFELCGVNDQEQVVYRKSVRRRVLMQELSQLEPCVIGMEACGGAHYWARRLRTLGHDVRLMAPQFVRPYRKSDKNDRNDAEAICEAVNRPSMRYVPIKDAQSQAVLSVHRIREQQMKQRTALVNQLRGLLAEFGVVVNKGVGHLRRALPEILEDAENALPDLMRELLAEQYEVLRQLDERIAAQDQRIKRLAQQSEPARRLMTMGGIGPLTATAMVASVGQCETFKSGRQFSAWLGLVPRHYGSGGYNRLGQISKRGDRYLRTLLVHGARSVMYTIDRRTDRKSEWARGVKARRGQNRAIVALAAKHARIIWALLSSGETYQPSAI